MVGWLLKYLQEVEEGKKVGPARLTKASRTEFSRSGATTHRGPAAAAVPGLDPVETADKDTPREKRRAKRK